jgi:hypothetical protein
MSKKFYGCRERQNRDPGLVETNRNKENIATNLGPFKGLLRKYSIYQKGNKN